MDGAKAMGEEFLSYATSPLDAFKAVRHGTGQNNEQLTAGKRVMLAFALVIALFIMYWLFRIAYSNTVGRMFGTGPLPGVYVSGFRSRFKGGNFSTGGNSPLWEGGSLSDQANLVVNPRYADASTVGATAWVGAGSGCPPGANPLATGEATRGQILQSLPAGASSCGAARLSDAALMDLAQ